MLAPFLVSYSSHQQEMVSVALSTELISNLSSAFALGPSFLICKLGIRRVLTLVH